MPRKLFLKLWLKLRNATFENDMTEILNNEPFRRNIYPDGVNIIASVRGGYSVEISIRLLIDQILHAGIPVYWYDYFLKEKFVGIDSTTTETSVVESELSQNNINIVQHTPTSFFGEYVSIDKSIWKNRYNIFYFIWEVEDFPREAAVIFDFFDEFWTPSEFSAIAVKKYTNKPQLTVPYAISTPMDPAADRNTFNLPADKFLFLCMYDFASIASRKNPDSVIAAYKAAFPKENEDCGLVIKVGHPSKEELSKLKEQLSDYNNVYLLTENYTKERVNSLIECVDAFVSLPRSEGFGLIMAEAMSLGTPVIATNYSAQTDFMDDSVGCMVDYAMVDVPEDTLWYSEGAKWAQPDIYDAARYIKKLYNDEEYRNGIIERARNRINTHLSMDAVSNIIRNRISEIYEANEEVTQ
jgi:glycosyltransferase involved in cell wall biosynthesis